MLPPAFILAKGYGLIIWAFVSLLLLPTTLLYLGFALALYHIGLSKRTLWDNTHIAMLSLLYTLSAFVLIIIHSCTYSSDTAGWPRDVFFISIQTIIPPLIMSGFYLLRKLCGYEDPFEDDNDEDYGL